MAQRRDLSPRSRHRVAAEWSRARCHPGRAGPSLLANHEARDSPRDVLAHKQWREIIPGLEAVDHRRGGVEQACKLHLRSGLNLGEMLVFLFFCSRVASAKTLSTMSATFPESVPAFSILASEAAAISAYFLGGSWGSSLLGKAGQSNCPSGKVLSMARPSVRASYLM